MKKLFYLIALCPVLCWGQDKVYHNDSSSSGEFYSYESGIIILIVDGSREILSGIDSVSFSHFNKSKRQYYKMMSDHEISFSFQDQTNIDVSVYGDDIKSRLIRFNKQRNSGFTVQAVGFGVIIIGAIATVPELAIAGAVVSLVGWIVKWTAGKHLDDNQIAY